MPLSGSGNCSFFSTNLHGSNSESGEPYDCTKMTALHATLPFGTNIEVTNKNNKQTVTARVIGRSRDVILSKAAFDKVASGEGSFQCTWRKEPSHIMISYQWGSEERVRKVVDILKEARYKIWIDKKDMSESISNTRRLSDGMLYAVEKAAVVLICLSDKYKESENCKKELRYTNERQKKFIPLRVQPNYKADGWDNEQFGEQLYYDVSDDHKMKQNMNELLKELKLYNIDEEDYPSESH